MSASFNQKHCQCPKKTDMHEFMRCSAWYVPTLTYVDECLIPMNASLGVLFCSKECQRKEWPNHRRECKNQQKLLRGARILCAEVHLYNTDYPMYIEGLQAPLSQNDSNFLHHVAWQDYLYFLVKINDGINKEYPSIPS